ncbi:MAG TPA: Spy/CpxP family protein refolding chaperone, partial [Pyrinomonadaceae bacterium]|nr:Spy/CpxP family protein refolding chaperone [Pyrinomonadaceae bacterium]
MKLKRIITGAVLAAVVALAGVAGFAQQEQGAQGQGKQERGWHRKGGEDRGMRGGFGGRMFEKLNLTDAQREQMKQIATRYHEGFKAQRQANRGERRGGFDALNGGTFDEAAVRAAAQARANAQVEMEVQRAHMMFEMYNVLTPEQKAQLAAERQQREQQREQRRQERRTRRQAG